MRILASASALAFVVSTAVAAQTGATLTATTHESAPPDGLAPALASQLSRGGVRAVVSKGPVTIDFWWVSGLPVRAGAARPSWADVEEGSLVGAATISAEFRDIRGRIIKPGTYTLRNGIQPSNGDHLGVSPFREFLLLSPAAVDTDPAPRGHDGTIELSKLTIGGSHPGVWSIDPPAATGELLQLHKTELDHDAVVVDVPVVREGKPAGSMKFGIVLVGRIEA
ncbi:MAG TPA: hypothetical protein VLD67_10305 [Vicinamibacterales bacterium]|nr:hypothetical protein [Vicinamibacterales bacterium]